MWQTDPACPHSGRAMKLSSIPQIYRHVGRWYEILEVLSKYGLAAWIGHLGPDFAKDLLKARGAPPSRGTPGKRGCGSPLPS